MKISAAEALLKVIEEHGVDVLFGYPGAANTPIYDNIGKTGICYILTRNEQGAAHAASSYFKMTGKVGVCTATSGPGATNLVTGIANAYMDSTPLVAITGQVIRSQVGKDAFQEVDMTGVTSPISKHNYLVKHAEDIPRIVNEAFYIAGTGRPGPVVIDIPMDLQKELIEYKPLGKPEIRGYHPDIETDVKQVAKMAKAVKKAKRPLMIAGGGILAAGASEAFTRLVETVQIPVVSTLMGIGSIPSAHRQYLGMIGSHGFKSANLAFAKADLVIFMGARVSDRAVADTAGLSGRATVIHVDIDPAEISKNVPCDISVIGNIRDVLAHLEREWNGYCCPAAWLEEAAGLKQYNPEVKGGEGEYVNPKYFLRMLSEATKGDAVIATEVGQNQIWTSNNYAFTKPNTFLTSGGFGTMGYGLPAAMGAKIARPDALVIAIEGDGSFQMSMPELGAIKQWGVNVKIVVFVNHSLGMVHEYQKVNYGGNYVSVDLGQYPRFGKIADAYDIPNLTIHKNSEVPGAIEKLLETEETFLLEVAVNPAETTL